MPADARKQLSDAADAVGSRPRTLRVETVDAYNLQSTSIDQCSNNRHVDVSRHGGCEVTLGKYGPHLPEETYIPHAYPERLFDTGETSLNYASAGSPDLPALVLIPAQSESWWGYEPAMDLLKEKFHVHAVDLRGQGRSGRTPGRYTLDNIGEDLVRFIAFRIRRPVIVSGLSSGGVIAAWLSAYAPPGVLRGAHYEDPPLFSSELNPERGPSIRQVVVGPTLALLNRYLGDQWSIGDEDGLAKASREAAQSLPPDVARTMAQLMKTFPADPARQQQYLKEYDPEWARAFVTGTVGASCDHARMLAAVKCPVLFTHHFRWVDKKSGILVGAISDQQASRVCELITATGQTLTYESFPEMGHDMHARDPELFATTLTQWADTLADEPETRSAAIFA